MRWIAMIGVTGIVAMFATEGELTPLDRVRFASIVAPGILTAVMAHVPIWVSRANVEEAGVWQISSGIYLVTFLAASASLGRYDFVNGRLLNKFFAKHTIYLFSTMLVLCNIILLSMNAVSWFGRSDEAPAIVRT